MGRPRLEFPEALYCHTWPVPGRGGEAPLERQWIKPWAQWTAVSCTLVIFMLSFSCATAPSSRKYVGLVFNSKASAQIEESFLALWKKWTVHFGATARVKSFSTPFSMFDGRGQGDGNSEFPLQIAATLMDSLLIEAGLQHYATLLRMTPEEQAEFRHSYYRRYGPINYLLIWCELQTIWAENYLAPRRWIIFLEDDTGNQYEPERISEESPPIPQMVMERWSGFQHDQERRGRAMHQKTLVLCFPKHDFYGIPLLSEKSRFLKLVFQLRGDEKTKAEGIWVFKK